MDNSLVESIPSAKEESACGDSPAVHKDGKHDDVSQKKSKNWGPVVLVVVVVIVLMVVVAIWGKTCESQKWSVFWGLLVAGIIIALIVGFLCAAGFLTAAWITAIILLILLIAGGFGASRWNWGDDKDDKNSKSGKKGGKKHDVSQD